MSKSPAECWYALHVRTNYEVAVGARLRDLGVQELIPMRDLPPGKNGRSPGKIPLFPGYVFCCMDLRTGPRLYTLSGVIRILGYGGHPTAIDEKEIQAIQILTRSPYPIQPHPFIGIGDIVTIADGPLCGVSGRLVHSETESTLIVSVALIQRSLAVTVPSQCGALQFARPHM
jgi:transcription antitermination factor NusG